MTISLTGRLSGPRQSGLRLSAACLYAASGSAALTFVDRATNAMTGLIVPASIDVSSAASPAITSPPGHSDLQFTDPSRVLISTPEATDTSTPVTVTLPNLPPGHYVLSARNVETAPAVLVVGKA